MVQHNRLAVVLSIAVALGAFTSSFGTGALAADTETVLYTFTGAAGWVWCTRLRM